MITDKLMKQYNFMDFERLYKVYVYRKLRFLLWRNLNLYSSVPKTPLYTGINITEEDCFEIYILKWLYKAEENSLFMIKGTEQHKREFSLVFLCGLVDKELKKKCCITKFTLLGK